MNELSQFSQFIIVAGFGVICFACGYLIAFILVRNSQRDEIGPLQLADRQMEMGRAAKRQVVNV